MFYIYILYSPGSDKFYIGYKNDYHRRLTEHNTSDRNTYTSKHRPWILKSVFLCSENETEAIKVERFTKKQKSRTLLEKLIDEKFPPDGLLAQLVRVPHLRD